MSNEDIQATYRILDASANRAGEGFRTMEEYARFVLNDDELTSVLKSMRHALASTMKGFSRDSLLAARDTVGDVGTDIREPAEYHRRDHSDVVSAAARRTQQSLRVLEEYGKTIDASVARSIEQLRYQSYTLSAQLEQRLLHNDRVARIRASRLYVLVDAGATEAVFAENITRLASGDVDVLQMRDPDKDDRTLLSRARLGTDIARMHGKLFIMNDRADLAVAADTDGVHVGQDELPVAETRQIVGSRRLVGVSTHSIEQARQAVADGADYIGCGPVFPGRTKSFDSYVGTGFLREVAAEIHLPSFAIGGIDASNLEQVIDAGFRRVAVTGAVRDANDPVAAAATLCDRLRSDQQPKGVRNQ